MAALPVLYSFRRCPYAIRARLALASSGLPYELREVLLRNKPAELLAASPKGTVPVLVLPTGEVIDESLDVMRWALRHNDPDRWLPAAPDAMEEALALIAEGDGRFKKHLDRYKYPNRYPAEHGNAHEKESGDDASQNPGGFAVAHRAAGARWLSSLQARLQAQAWLFGAQASLADMAVLPLVRQFAHTDAAWFAAQAWPQLQAWLTRFETSPLYQRVMDKPLPWPVPGP